MDFSREEYDLRVGRVRRSMRARNIDVLIVDQFEHLVYLFGYLPTAAKYQACLLPLEQEPHMIVRGMDRGVFQHQSWVTSYREFSDAEGGIAVAAEELEARYGTSVRIGLEMDSHILTVERYRYLLDRLPRCDFVDFSHVMEEQRLIKSEAEIAYLREAASIADLCMSGAIEAAAVGASEREPAAAAYSIAMRHGADNGRVLLSASGSLSGSIHGRLGMRRLEDGDVLHLEMVPQVRGYSARLMRPTLIGAAKPETLQLATRLAEIQDEQIGAMKPGTLASDIDAIGRGKILGEKLCASYLNHTGYTLGYHAQPRTSDHTRIFTPAADWKLEPGMVFHMFIAVRGLAFGETVLVTEAGHERLTKTAHRAFER